MTWKTRQQGTLKQVGLHYKHRKRGKITRRNQQRQLPIINKSILIEKQSGINIQGDNYVKYKTKKGEKIIGETILFPTGESASLGTIEVKKAFRGKGYGTKLLKAVEEDAKKLGVKRLEVPAVDNHTYFIKQGYYYTGKGRVFEKDLTDKPLTSKQKQQTDKYVEVFGVSGYKEE